MKQPKPSGSSASKKAVKQPKDKVHKKKALPKGYNPITRQPREKKSGMGFVEGGNLNLDNILDKPRRRKKRTF